MPKARHPTSRLCENLPMRKRISLIFTAVLMLSGCDQINQKLGLEDLGKKEARLEAEGKAVGSACRQSGRAIEDCYAIYSWLPKASVFEGWREMDAYMRENNIETIAPMLPPPEAPGRSKKRAKAASEDIPEATAEKTEKPAEPPSATETPATKP
jgi:hypothetical protein